MADDILFVGLDVHKKTISVATVLEKPGESCRYYGSIPNTPDSLRRLCQKLRADDASLYFCYEAGPCGCGVQRLLTRLGHRCDLVAPTLIPRPMEALGRGPGEERSPGRDEPGPEPSRRAFAESLDLWGLDTGRGARGDARAGARLQTLAKRDIRRARQQLLSFLLRHGVHYPGRHWSKAPPPLAGPLVVRSQLRVSGAASGFGRTRAAGRAGRGAHWSRRWERIEQSMVDLLPRWTLAPVVEAVQALRGISILNGITLVAEIGSFSRFENPRQLMAYLGLVPSEHSSGSTTRRGPITKTGNSLARTCPKPDLGVEAAWTYRFPARVSRIILERSAHLPEPIRAVGWKAQVRLCRRYRHLMATGKAAPPIRLARWSPPSPANWSASSGPSLAWSSRSAPDPAFSTSPTGKRRHATRE